MEFLIAILIVGPAVILGVLRSDWLVDYAIMVLAFNRGVRRMADYYLEGHFDPFSPISVTPLVVAMLLLIVGGLSLGGLSKRSRTPILLIGASIGLGFAVGVITNRSAAFYSLGEWCAGLGAMAFAATQPATCDVADRWIKTAGWCGVLVAIYGWWQYYTIPPWDGMWLVQSGMAGYMGEPEPTKMTVFSTLNERGPCGSFLAWAVIPMIINRRWRNFGGWLSVLLILSSIVLTQVRSSFIVIAIVALLYPVLTGGRGVLQVLLLTGLLIGGATWGLQQIPGMATMTDRFSADALYGEGSSLHGRMMIYHDAVGEVLSRPLGLGLGCSGMGGRLESNSVQGVSDSGYLQIIAQFGWLGAALFFCALWMLWKELSIRWFIGRAFLRADAIDPFIPATRAILVTSLVLLFVTDIFAGFSLLWILFGRALNAHSEPESILMRASALLEGVTTNLTRRIVASGVVAAD
jgi:hypothetical protein